MSNSKSTGKPTDSKEPSDKALGKQRLGNRARDNQPPGDQTPGMANNISASAPGKVIILGDHVVVNGYPGFVVPISQRATCTITGRQHLANSRSDKGHLNVKLGDFGIQQSLSADEIASNKWLTEMKLVKHQALERDDISSYLEDFKSSPLNLVRAALETAIEFVLARVESSKSQTEQHISETLAGLELEVVSQIPQGGFGSSTAVTVAIIKAILQLFDLDYAPEELGELAISAESFFYANKPSGLDQYCVSFNSGIVYQKGISSPQINRINIENISILGINVIDNTTPLFATGEVVAYLQREIQVNPVKKAAFDELGKLTTELIAQIKDNGVSSISKQEWISAFRKIHRLHLVLGIVTECTAKIIAAYEKSGGGAKISGAGTIAHLDQTADSGKVIGIA